MHPLDLHVDYADAVEPHVPGDGALAGECVLADKVTAHHLAHDTIAVRSLDVARGRHQERRGTVGAGLARCGRR